MSSVASTLPPPKLTFDSHTYLSVLLSTPPPTSLTQPQTPILTSPVPISYVSPVGALSDEHLFAVDLPAGGQAWKDVERDVLRALKEQEGVRKVKVLDPPKQRVKRDEF